MDRSEIFQKIINIIKPFCKDEAALNNATDSSRFLEDLRINSARLVDIVLNMEDEFNIEIDDASADKIQTVGDAVQLIFEKRTATAN